MKVKSFAPLLAPNESVDLSTLQYPLLASTKLDGIRCIFKDGEILSRSLKPIPNKQLKEKFELIRQFSYDNNCLLDGEIYSPELTFQQIISYVMTDDLTDKKTIKKNGCILTIPNHLKFYCFDYVKDDNFNEPFQLRTKRVQLLEQDLKHPFLSIVQQRLVKSSEEVNYIFDQALLGKSEGLILRSLNGNYKFGRGTIKEGIIYKVKSFITFDAKITGIVQSSEVKEDAEKKINELGRSVTSKKKDDRVLIEKASAFNVLYEGKELKVTLAMTDEEKEEVWLNKESYIGRMIEYKGMLVGAKEVPRHPVMIRFREDKN